MSSRRGMPAYVEDYDETTGTVDQDNRQVASTKKSKAHDRLQARRNGKGTRKVASPKKSKGHRDSREPRISFSGPQYPGESSSRDAPAVEEEKVVGLVERREAFGLDDPWGPGVMPESVIKKFNRGPGASLPVGGSGGVSSRASKNMVSEQQVTNGPNTRKNSIVASPFSSAAPKTQATTPTSNPDRSINESQHSPSVTGSGGAEAHTTPDTTSGFGSRFAASVSRLFRPDSSSLPNPSPSPAENKRASPEEKIRQQDEEIRRRAPIPLRPRQYNPSNITWGPTTVLDGVKETVVPTQQQPAVIWGPTTILGRTKSPPIVARGTRTSPSQDLDSDDSSTQSTDDYSQQRTSRDRRKKSTQRRYIRFVTSGSAASRLHSEPASLEEAESRKQTSRGTRDSQGTDAELLKNTETYEQSQQRSDEVDNEHGALVIADFGLTAFHKEASRSRLKAEYITGSPSYEGKREAEFLSDEQTQQQEDEIRGPLGVPTASHTRSWAGFDVQGYEPGNCSIEQAELNWENFGAQLRNNKKDVLTPDGINYSTTLNSEDRDSDDDDAVLHSTASAPSLETSSLDTGEDTPKRPVTGRGNRWLTGLKDLGAQEEEYFNTSDDEDDILGKHSSSTPLKTVEPLESEIYREYRKLYENERYWAKQHEFEPAKGAGQSQPSLEPVGERSLGSDIENDGNEAQISQVHEEILDWSAVDVPGSPKLSRLFKALEIECSKPVPPISLDDISSDSEEPTCLSDVGMRDLFHEDNNGLAVDLVLQRTLSKPGTVPIVMSFEGQAAEMLDEYPKLPEHVRENQYPSFLTRSYLPVLDSPNGNEHTSTRAGDERETGLIIDDEPLLPPPFYPSLKSGDQLRIQRQPSPTPSVESLQSLVDSIFSLASLSSASTAPGSDNAFQRVFAILQADAVLKDLYVELTARTSAVKFKRNFGILLKRFAVDLERESSCYNEQRTATFIRSRARKIAQRIVDAMYPSGSTIEGAHISMPLAQTKAESSEDSETDEEPDEYLELERFVTDSRSFQNLRDNIRGFLGLELSKLLAELPFVDEDRLAEFEESINSVQNPLSCGKFVWSMRNFHHKIRDFLFPEPPIPNGLNRVRWKCPCGETLYDDYEELKPSAVERMEDYLRRSSYKRCAGETKSLSERISNVWSSFRGITTFVSQWTGILKNNGGKTIVHTELRYYSDARTTRTPAHTSGEVFYLLLCHKSGVGAEVVKLRQPDICDINNDQKLFSFLHEEYLTLRKRWWTWISLWTLQSIKFVRFELYEHELVDVKKLDDVPPPTKDNEYRHGPPNPPELNPPLGSTLLMHLFKHPELAGTKKKCLQKIPRKLRNRLAVLDEDDDAIGWGLQFIEGWSKKRLMYMTALTFGFSSVVVMVLVSILGHDVQNAGAIASFMLSFVTIGVATAQAAMHMN